MVSGSEQSTLTPQGEVPQGQNEGATHRTALLSSHPLFSLPVAIGIGLLLRVLLIGSKSMWLDEAMSLQVTQAGPAAWLSGAAEAYHPPLYYAFLHYWIQLGQSEGILRSSSALFGVLAIPSAYLLARNLAGRGVALSTAWLVALSPLLVWYSQEFRSYSLLVFLGLLSSLAFVRVLLRPQASALVGWWLLYVIATSAALYTHYDALLLLPIQFSLLLVLLAQRRVSGLGVGAALAAWPMIVVVYWPWLSSPAAQNFIGFAKLTGGYPGMLLERVLGVSLPLATLAAVALGVVAVAAILGTWILVRRRGLWPAIYRSPVVRAALVIAFVMLLFLSVWPRGYSVKRLMVISVPFICLLVAWFWPMAGRISRTLSVLLLLSAVAALVNVIAIPKDDWRATAYFLQGAYQEGDAIWIAPGYDSLPFEYYNQGGLPVTQIDELQGDGLDSLPIPRGRVWLIYNDAPTRFLGVGPELEARLASRFSRAQDWSAYRVRTVLFVSR